MTVYAESSAVLRWLFGESGSVAILRELQTATKVVSSRLTLIETRRTIRRALREQRLTEAEAGDVVSILEQATPRWAILEIGRDVARRAQESFPREPVRTLDAIHLASMLVLRQALPDLTVLSTDERIRDNAVRLGLRLRPA